MADIFCEVMLLMMVQLNPAGQHQTPLSCVYNSKCYWHLVLCISSTVGGVGVG